MKNEKTIKGNPNKLVINQHIQTNKSISNFKNSKGLINVFLKNYNKSIYVKSNNEVFCGKRIWSQKSEKGFIKDIEDNFHKELDFILINEKVINHKAISEYFLLWRIKFLLNHSDNQDVKLNMISGSNYSKKVEEYIESNGLSFHRGNIVTSRFINSLNLILLFDSYYKNVENLNWVVVKSSDGEFIVSDCYNKYFIFPITPNMILIENSNKTLISIEELKFINRVSINESKHFYFAKDLNKCPV